MQKHNTNQTVFWALRAIDPKHRGDADRGGEFNTLLNDADGRGYIQLFRTKEEAEQEAERFNGLSDDPTYNIEAVEFTLNRAPRFRVNVDGVFYARRKDIPQEGQEGAAEATPSGEE